MRLFIIEKIKALLFIIFSIFSFISLMSFSSTDPGINFAGNNNDIAKNNAIAAASKEAGKRIVALINSKGLN